MSEEEYVNSRENVKRWHEGHVNRHHHDCPYCMLDKLTATMVRDKIKRERQSPHGLPKRRKD